MTTKRAGAVRRRPVTLTWNVKVVTPAKKIADNLSGVDLSLLTECVAKDRHERLAKSEAMTAAVATWNRFKSRRGSLAEE
jgi:hypothetical protein